MKIVVCSDSHGNSGALQEVLDKERPELVLFLGDGERDWQMVNVPVKTGFLAVCGNCDFMAMEPSYRRFALCGKRIFMTHGHLYGAKQGLYGLSLQVQQHPADLVLYGHTHRPKWEEYEGCLYLCPGSIGYNEENYVVLTLDENSANIDFSFQKL